MLDLREDIRSTIMDIIFSRLPDCELRVFGSRVRGTAKPYSDVDIAIVGKTTIEFEVLSKIREALEYSDIPIRVEVLDWRRLAPEFRAVVDSCYEVLKR